MSRGLGKPASWVVALAFRMENRCHRECSRGPAPTRLWNYRYGHASVKIAKIYSRKVAGLGPWDCAEGTWML